MGRACSYAVPMVRLDNGWVRLESGWVRLENGWVRLENGWVRLENGWVRLESAGSGQGHCSTLTLYQAAATNAGNDSDRDKES